MVVLWHRLRAPLYLAFNFASSIGIILTNKALFSELHFPAPSLLTAIQYFVIWVLSVTQRHVEAARHKGQPVAQRQPKINNFFFMALLMGLPVMVSNYSLELNNVGFYQLAKALQMPTIVLMDWVIASKAPPSSRCIAALTAVFMGVLISSVNDVSVQLIGCCVALSNLPLQCAQKVLISKHVREGHDSLLFLERLMPTSGTCLALLSLPLEGREIWAFGFRPFLGALPGIIISAVAAFFAQWSSCLVLGHTSATTYQVAGQLKSCALIIGGCLFAHQQKSNRVIGGAMLAIAAGLFYTVWNIKDQKVQKAEDKRKWEMKRLGDVVAV